MEAKERPACRKEILKHLMHNTKLDLFKIAFWDKYDNPSLRYTSGMMKQARKMLDEKGLNYDHLLSEKETNKNIGDDKIKKG